MRFERTLEARLILICWALSKEASGTNFILYNAFGMTQSGIEPMTFRSRGERSATEPPWFYLAIVLITIKKTNQKEEGLFHLHCAIQPSRQTLQQIGKIKFSFKQSLKGVMKLQKATHHWHIHICKVAFHWSSHKSRCRDKDPRSSHIDSGHSHSPFR